MRKLMFTVLGLLMVHSMQAQYFCTKQGTELHYVATMRLDKVFRTEQ